MRLFERVSWTKKNGVVNGCENLPQARICLQLLGSLKSMYINFESEEYGRAREVQF